MSELQTLPRATAPEADREVGQGSAHGTELKVFSGRNSVGLSRRVCAHIASQHQRGFELGDAKTHVFEDSELLVKLDDDVRGRDCFVVASTSSPANENLMELLIFADCLMRASAQRITMVVPYFGYARQDRKDAGRVPITAKLVANLMTASRADRVVTIDLHAAQIQGFFDLPFDHLTATPIFEQHFRLIREQLGDLCLVSPDVGNVKVAEGMADLLDAELAVINKRRVSGSEVKVGNIIGSVKNKTVLMFDDMISTAGTICKAAELVMDHGARDVIAAATHAVLVGPAMERLSNSPISKVIVTDTVPCDVSPGGRCEPIKDKLELLSVGALLGDAIWRIHHDESISALFVGTAGPKR